jgi:Domain of unknown function (DUF4365)
MTGETDLTARRGVERVRSMLVSNLGWCPREPVDPDYGIDVYVETAVRGVPEGRMLAMQVKSGSSYFRERTETHVRYRPTGRHVSYWLAHSLPVVVALYDPDDDVAYWEIITSDTLHSAGAGWRVDVPFDQRLDANSAEALRELVEGDAYVLGLNALHADRSWMLLLREGGTVYLEVDEWVNKSSGRGGLRLIGTPTVGGEPLSRERTFYFGFANYADVLPRLFPWASLSVDGDTYSIYYDEDEWPVGHHTHESGLHPYEFAAGGEVERWRLELTLGALGEAFLRMDEYLSAKTNTTPDSP